MITLTIQGNTYELPNTWSDVPLSRFITFQTDIAPLEPPCMYDNEPYSDATFRDVVLPYIVRYVAFWAGAPEAVLMACKLHSLLSVYRGISHSFAILPVPDDNPCLEHEGQLWYLPNKAFEGSTVQDFIEAAQYQDQAERLELGEWGVLPKLMCILVRKEGEAYSSELMEREQYFMGWPMDKVFQVSFFLHRLGQIYLQSSQYLDAAQDLTKLKLVLKSLGPSMGGMRS